MKKTVMREKREWGFEGFREIYMNCEKLYIIHWGRTLYVYKGVPLILAQQVTNASVTN